MDGELPISVCDGCDRVGYASVTDAETTTLLLVDEDFQCDRCRNDDVGRFEVWSPHPDRLCVECLNCSGVTDVSLKDWSGGNEGPNCVAPHDLSLIHI